MRFRRSETRPNANRARVTKLAVVLTGVIGAAVAGYGVGSRVQSPAEAAWRRAAPDASRITVPVERQALENSLVRRGSVRFADAKGLSLAGPVGSAPRPSRSRRFGRPARSSRRADSCSS